MEWLLINVNRLKRWFVLFAFKHRTVGALANLVLGAMIGTVAMSMMPTNAPFFSVALCISAGAFSMLLRWRPRRPFQMTRRSDWPYPADHFE